ncbi:MAG TPA: ATP-binding cassette domain-containing protein [bacterium]|nr:ATP-binding cassette domain-containing protein [bacterium]
MEIIKVVNLKVVFEAKVVLDMLNLSVEKGESIVLVGSSGCGKTVLIKTIIGLIEPVEGEIFINGQNILNLPEEKIREIRSRIGMVFQNSALFDSLTTWENVGFYYLYHTDKSKEEIKKMAIEVLENVGLEGVEDLMPEQLSGGMKKRVSIARALISRPEILFYDEPTTGLDPITSSNITSLMKKIHLKFNTTDVIVTHDIKLAREISDRIGLVENGKIVEIGTFDFLREKSNHPLIRSFVEMEGKNE